MRSTNLILALAVVLALAPGASAEQSPTAPGGDGKARFRRGIGIHTLLNWAALSPRDRTRYRWPPFSGPEFDLPDALLARAKADGFDFVRLTVDPGPFLQMTGPRRRGLDGLLLAAVRRLRAHGFSVMVNFHGNSQVVAYAPERVLSDPGAPIFGAYVAVVARTAGLLGTLDDPDVAFEPVNEPPFGYDDRTARRWQVMMEALYAAARGAAPRLPVVVTGAQGGSRYGLVKLDPSRFDDALYSFHFYEPHLLTHQATESAEPGTGFWRLMRGLPYPASKAGAEAAFTEARRAITADPNVDPADRPRRIAEARVAIDAYVSEDWGRATIEGAFDEVARWAAINGLDPRRILLGEFGATRIDPASDRSRATWLRDVRCAAERRSYRWSLWVLTGTGGMAIASATQPAALDPRTLGALDLPPGTGERCTP